MFRIFKRSGFSAGIIPYVVFGISFFLTLVASFIYYMTVLSKDRIRFETSVVRNHYAIEDRILTYIDLLHTVEGLLVAYPQTTQSEFKTFVDQLEFQKQHPGIAGIGYLARVSSQEKDTLVQRMRNEGVTDFSIWPNTDRDESYVIIYLEPQDKLRKSGMGYDMFTEQIRREAMIQARDSGNPSASKKVTLVQGNGNRNQPGFLIYLPLYQNGIVPETIEERRSKLLGFVYSPFHIYDLFNAINDKRKTENIDFRVYEGNQQTRSTLLYESQPDDKNYSPFFSRVEHQNISGVPWTFVYASTPRFDMTSERTLVPYIFYSGLMISLILFFLSRSQYLAEQKTEKALEKLSKSQEALNESSTQIKNILHSITDGFISLDKKWNFVYVNKTASEILGASSKELIGKNIWEVIPDLHETKFGKLYKKAVKEKTKQEIEDYYSPHESWYTARAFPSKSGLSIYFHDITERKILEQRKDEFISIASHELRTPLTTIKGYVQILERVMEKNDFTRMKLYLDRTNIYINKLHELISDLLDVSKIQAGKLTFNISPFSYTELVHEVVESIQPTSQKHKINIIIKSDKVINGDRNRIEQVLNNLINNGVKYSPEAKDIIITVTEKDNSLVTSVRDHGVGISQKDQKKLFQRFYRAQKTSKNFAGLGIGLFISSDIVRRHGGSIWVESQEGKGSTFFFSLPIS